MSFRDFFRRGKVDDGPILPEGFGDSPEQWRPGDIAVCVEDGPWRSLDGAKSEGPAFNQALAVMMVGIIEGRQFLSFASFPGQFYASVSFAKARPDERKAATPEFIRRMRALRGKVDA